MNHSLSKGLQALTIALALSSCSTLESNSDGRLRVLGGLQDSQIGDREVDRAAVAVVELELDPSTTTGVVGVIGVTGSNSDAKGVEVQGFEGQFDAEIEAVGAHAGLRWRPTTWDYALTPMIGGGLAFQDVRASGAGEHVGDSALGGYAEIGVEWKNLSLTYRHTGGMSFDLDEVGDDEAYRSDALLLGYSFSF